MPDSLRRFMRIYTLESDTRKALTRALGVRFGVMLIAIVLVVLAIGVFFVLRFTGISPLAGIGLMVLAAVVLAIVIGMQLLRQIQEYQKVLDSIRFTSDGEILIRHQLRLPDEKIVRTEVVALNESTEGMMVLTEDRSRYIFVPSDLAGYSALRQVLGRWHSVTQIEVISQNRSGGLSALWAVGTLVCVGVLLFSQQLWQVVVVGVVMLVVYILTYRMLRQQGSLDRRFNRTYEGILLFLCIVFFIKVIMVVWPLFRP